MNIREIMEIINFLGNLSVVIITVMTFYLTIWSNKISIIGLRENFSAFYGKEIFLQVKNHTLHPICINTVALYYLRGGQIVKRKLREFDISFVIPQWEIATFSSKRYTDVEAEDLDMFEPFLAEFCCGTKTVYAYKGNLPVIEKKRFLRIAHRAIKRKAYEIVTVETCAHNQKVLSPSVKYAVAIKTKSGEYQQSHVTDYGFMSNDIFGYNALPKEACKNEESLKELLISEFGLDEVIVESVR